MTSRSRKKFPVRVSETKRVKITQACFKSLTAADLSPNDDFDHLFNFQGPVISECTIRDWLLSGACHGAGYMLVLHVVLVHSRKRLVAKRRLSWRRIYAGVACGACLFVVAKTWNSAGPIPPSRCLVFMLFFYHRHMSAWLFHPAVMLSSCT